MDSSTVPWEHSFQGPNAQVVDDDLVVEHSKISIFWKDRYFEIKMPLGNELDLVLTVARRMKGPQGGRAPS